jgi:hypothetical protein
MRTEFENSISRAFETLANVNLATDALASRISQNNQEFQSHQPNLNRFSNSEYLNFISYLKISLPFFKGKTRVISSKRSLLQITQT